MVIAQTEEVAVCVSRLAGYPTGFEFELRTLAAPGHEDLELDPIMFGPHRHGRRGREQELEDDVLRFGVQFADGSKATNVAGFHSPEDPPDAPVMHSGGGGGGGGDWRQTEWVWPLPPPGPLSFVCEWPAAEIPLTRAELDARIVIDAAARAQVIFPRRSLSAIRPGGHLEHIRRPPEGQRGMNDGNCSPGHRAAPRAARSGQSAARTELAWVECSTH